MHNSHEIKNVTKAVDHKPTDSKTCTEFRDDHHLTIGDILQIPLILMHAQTNKKLLLHKKSSDPLNLPMTPIFSNKGSSMTPKNYGLAETLVVDNSIIATSAVLVVNVLTNIANSIYPDQTDHIGSVGSGSTLIKSILSTEWQCLKSLMLLTITYRNIKYRYIGYLI